MPSEPVAPRVARREVTTTWVTTLVVRQHVSDQLVDFASEF